MNRSLKEKVRVSSTVLRRSSMHYVHFVSNVRRTNGRILFLVGVSVVDPNTLNLDPDPGFWPNLDPDPDLGLYNQFWKRKNSK